MFFFFINKNSRVEERGQLIDYDSMGEGGNGEGRFD